MAAPTAKPVPHNFIDMLLLQSEAWLYYFVLYLCWLLRMCHLRNCCNKHKVKSNAKSEKWQEMFTKELRQYHAVTSEWPTVTNIWSKSLFLLQNSGLLGNIHPCGCYLYLHNFQSRSTPSMWQQAPRDYSQEPDVTSQGVDLASKLPSTSFNPPFSSKPNLMVSSLGHSTSSLPVSFLIRPAN